MCGSTAEQTALIGDCRGHARSAGKTSDDVTMTSRVTHCQGLKLTVVTSPVVEVIEVIQALAIVLWFIALRGRQAPLEKPSVGLVNKQSIRAYPSTSVGCVVQR